MAATIRERERKAYTALRPCCITARLAARSPERETLHTLVSAYTALSGYGVVLPLEVELVALPSERHLHKLVSANSARRAAVARGLERNERSFAESVGRVDGVTESRTLAVANILAVVVEKEDSARIHDGRRQALTQKLEHL